MILPLIGFAPRLQMLTAETREELDAVEIGRAHV